MGKPDAKQREFALLAEHRGRREPAIRPADRLRLHDAVIEGDYSGPEKNIPMPSCTTCGADYRRTPASSGWPSWPA